MPRQITQNAYSPRLAPINGCPEFRSQVLHANLCAIAALLCATAPPLRADQLSTLGNFERIDQLCTAATCGAPSREQLELDDPKSCPAYAGPRDGYLSTGYRTEYRIQTGGGAIVTRLKVTSEDRLEIHDPILDGPIIRIQIIVQEAEGAFRSPVFFRIAQKEYEKKGFFGTKYCMKSSFEGYDRYTGEGKLVGDLTWSSPQTPWHARVIIQSKNEIGEDVLLSSDRRMIETTGLAVFDMRDVLDRAPPITPTIMRIIVYRPNGLLGIEKEFVVDFKESARAIEDERAATIMRQKKAELAEEEKRKQEDKAQAALRQKMLNELKNKCKELGFALGSDNNARCVLELMQ